jgi:hypothetical protein
MASGKEPKETDRKTMLDVGNCMQHDSLNRIALISLALVLALMLHDAVMAVDPHGVDFGSGSHPNSHHAPHGSLTPDATSARESTRSTLNPSHPNNCGVVLPAVAPRMAMPTADAAMTSVGPLLDACPHLPLIESRHPPTRPPHVRRALTQVYRI